MSADNWGRCPLCESKKLKALKELKAEYGKVSQEEYENLKEELEDDEKEDGKDTLREDYEQGVDDKGYAYVIYSGVCQKCGASWQFKKEDILPEYPEDVDVVKRGVKA